MEIVRSAANEITRIFALCDAGTTYQKAMGGKQGQGSGRSPIEMRTG